MRTVDADWVTWLLVLVGFSAAVFRSRRAALCVLSLSPLLFYRNAFPYYYVVMLAPAAVLVAVGVDWLTKLAGRRADAVRPNWIPVAFALPLILQAILNLDNVRPEGQELQEMTIRAVHEIFPEPVPYIDHSGMIASFPKANFFMSSWGIERYRKRGLGFMEPAIAEQRPPMLIANAPVLMPGSYMFSLLLDEDRGSIERYYLPYWGVIRIAGAELSLEPGVAAQVRLPFPGRYRVESDSPVTIDGDEFSHGAILEISEDNADRTVSAARVGLEPGMIRLVWAEARPAPPGSPPTFASIYSNL